MAREIVVQLDEADVRRIEAAAGVSGTGSETLLRSYVLGVASGAVCHTSRTDASADNSGKGSQTPPAA